MDAAEIADDSARASLAEPPVLVETFVRGASCRLLAVGGCFVAALDVAVLALVGDGKRRIDDLLDALNRDSFRNGVRPYQVKIDGDLRARLARAGCALDDLLT